MHHSALDYFISYSLKIIWAPLKRIKYSSHATLRKFSNQGGNINKNYGAKGFQICSFHTLTCQSFWIHPLTPHKALALITK